MVSEAVMMRSLVGRDFSLEQERVLRQDALDNFEPPPKRRGAPYLEIEDDALVYVDEIRKHIDSAFPNEVTWRDIALFLSQSYLVANTRKRQAQASARAYRKQSLFFEGLWRDEYKKLRVASSRNIGTRTRAAILHSSAKCAACGSRDSLQIDHIVPFSRGGLSVESNLQALCSKCNNSKSDRDYHDWLESRGYVEPDGVAVAVIGGDQ